jgi:hypothetical protein
MPSCRFENRIYSWAARSLLIRIGDWNYLHALRQLSANILKNVFPRSPFALRQTKLYGIWQSFQRASRTGYSLPSYFLPSYFLPSYFLPSYFLPSYFLPSYSLPGRKPTLNILNQFTTGDSPQKLFWHNGSTGSERLRCSHS